MKNMKCTMLMPFHSEVFGAAEDDSPEMDHSEDSENGKRPLKVTDLFLGTNSRTR